MGTGFDGPDDIEAGIWVGEGHGVVHFELGAEAGRGEFGGTGDLLGADGDAGDVEAVRLGEDAAATADAAADVEDGGAGGKVVEAAPADHFVDEVDFGLAEVGASVGDAVVAEVDVFAPVEFEDAVFGPIVVGVGDAVGVFVFAGGEEVESDRDRRQCEEDGEGGGQDCGDRHR